MKLKNSIRSQQYNQKEIYSENGLLVHQEGSSKPVFVADSAFLRLPQILKLIPISKSTWWAGIASGRFPMGIKIGTNTTVWRVGDIKQLLLKLSGEKPQNNEVNHA